MRIHKYFKISALIIAIPILSYAVWFFGIFFELEYPYIFSIKKVNNSQTITGNKSKAIISQQLGINQNKVNFHKCSYCQDLENGFPQGTIRFQVLHDEISYVFAYDPEKNILYPASDETETKFPSMGRNVRNERYAYKTQTKECK